MKKTKIEKGYGELLREELEAHIEEVEGKELTDDELEDAAGGFSTRFSKVSMRVRRGKAITDAIGKVTADEIKGAGKATEIRFGDKALAAQMNMVAFD